LPIPLTASNNPLTTALLVHETAVPLYPRSYLQGFTYVILVDLGKTLGEVESMALQVYYALNLFSTCS
jgi:hypothetical protein